jgi:hypothetical protein
MERMIDPSGLVWLAILKLAVGPCHEVSGWLQTSWVLPPPELAVGNDCETCCVNVGAPAGIDPGVPDVACGRGVLDGGRVGLGVSVGGTGVAVGTAAWVSATMVSAAASAVCCMSTGFAVGVPWGAQALASKMNTTPRSNRFRLIL